VTCNEDTIGRLLADYYTAELSLPEQQRVEAHVAHCEDCRKALHLMDVLSRPGEQEQYRSGHLAPERIADYVQHRDAWPADQVLNLKEHLDRCDTCAREFDFVSGMDEELSAAAAQEGGRREAVGLSERLWRIVAAPAFAWLLLLLAVYPAVSWLNSYRRQSREEATTRVTGPVHTLLEARRGAASRVVVNRSGRDALVRLAIPFYAVLDEMTYQFSLTRLPDAVPADVEMISNFETEGMVLLLLNTQSLDDADYVLSVREIGRADGQPKSGRTYQFRLVTDR